MIFHYRFVTLIFGILISFLATKEVFSLEDNIRIGILTSPLDSYSKFSLEAKRGSELAVAEFQGKIDGTQVKLIFESENNFLENLTTRLQRLVNTQQVDLIVGPMIGSDSQALKAFAHSNPHITFLNGASAARNLTLTNPAVNFFRFTTDSSQWMAGLGQYAYHNKKYRKVVTLSEGYSFANTQVMAFLSEFCQQGGALTKQIWAPITDKPYNAITEELLKVQTDAIFIALSGNDTAHLLKHYWNNGGRVPIITGTTTLNPSLFTAKFENKNLLLGTISATPIADSSKVRSWQKFVNAYQAHFRDKTAIPSLFTLNYYINTKAVLLALKEEGDDAYEDPESFREALSELEFETPTGYVSLNENRQAIANNFIVEITENYSKPHFAIEVVKITSEADQIDSKLKFCMPPP